MAGSNLTSKCHNRVVAVRTKKQRLQKECRAASAEYHRITRYLKAASGSLTTAERSLLLEFAETAKRNCERFYGGGSPNTRRDGEPNILRVRGEGKAHQGESVSYLHCGGWDYSCLNSSL